jgi:chromate transporter
VRDQHWLTDQQFVDAIAVAMITPGPVVITVAFIGFLVAGVPGAVVSAAAIFAPVYLMVVIAAPAFRRWSARPAIRAFVGGVTAAAAGGITGAAIVLAERSVHDAFGMFLAIIAACAAAARVPEPAVVAAGGLAGLTARGLL